MNINYDNTNMIVNMISDRLRKREHGVENIENSDCKGTVEDNCMGDLTDLHKDIQDVNQNWDVELPVKIFSHRRFIGDVIVFGKKIFRKFLTWYIQPAIQKQRIFNASITRSVNGIFEFVNKLQAALNALGLETKQNKLELDNTKKLLEDYKNQVDNTKELLDGYRKQVANTNEIIETYEKQVANTDKVVETYEKQLSNLELLLEKYKNQGNDKIERLEKEIVRLNNIVDQNIKRNNDMNYIKERLFLINRSVTALSNGEDYNHQSIVNANLLESAKLDIDYLDFEDHFRGSQDEISAKMSYYLQYFKEGDIVLDIGCGRGEFLELLRSKNCNAIGIDLNEDMVQLSKNKGLNVSEHDAIDYLRAIPDNYFNGIFMGQVVEHLEPNYLIELLELSYDKLKQGGFLIIETQNPMCLSIYAYGFYIDPTHTKPVHPYTLKYLVESKCFGEVEIKLLSPVPQEAQLQLVEGGIADANIKDVLNNNINKLNALLFGYQDYAVITSK